MSRASSSTEIDAVGRVAEKWMVELRLPTKNCEILVTFCGEQYDSKYPSKKFRNKEVQVIGKTAAKLPR